MIVDFFLNLVFLFVFGITQIFVQFGDVVPNTSITDSLLTIKGYYLSLNGILPIDVLLSIIAFDLTFEGVYFIYKLIRWSYKKVPTIS